MFPPAPVDQWENKGYSRLFAQLLSNRGIHNPAQLEEFITADQRLSNDPFLMPDIQKAVTRIYQALLAGENIAVYGDFDADGVTGTAILVKGLSALGGNVIPYIPHRSIEGHGLKTTALEELHKQGIRLVISVDCGITGVAEVKKARNIGLDVIITDHHTPLAEIPPAFAIINPKMPNSHYPFTDLAGVGVAFKLVEALYHGMGKDKQQDELMDLVALGTIADMVPLLGENRYLAKQGMSLINTAPRLGIKEMINQTQLNLGGIGQESISWVIAPRLNAAGRLDHATPSYQLLMTDSTEEAHKLAEWLEQKNVERQRLTTKVLENAREQVLAQGITPLLIASGSDYPGGILGLVAGKLCEEFYRPAIVIRTGENNSNGSCRSIPEFDIIAALGEYSSLFTQFGGHSQAAGFSIPSKKLDQLIDGLRQLAGEQLADIELRPHLNIDAEVTFNELGGSTYDNMQQLAPFGNSNPTPTFLTRKVDVVDCQTMGNTGDHLRLKLKQKGMLWNCVGFRLGSYLDEVISPIDIVYNLERDQWNGVERMRLNILDFAPTKTTTTQKPHA
jgi:single-stranded-DNA-specific exonuclease